MKKNRNSKKDFSKPDISKVHLGEASLHRTDILRTNPNEVLFAGSFIYEAYPNSNFLTAGNLANPHETNLTGTSHFIDNPNVFKLGSDCQNILSINDSYQNKNDLTVNSPANSHNMGLLRIDNSEDCLHGNRLGYDSQSLFSTNDASISGDIINNAYSGGVFINDSYPVGNNISSANYISPHHVTIEKENILNAHIGGNFVNDTYPSGVSISDAYSNRNILTMGNPANTHNVCLTETGHCIDNPNVIRLDSGCQSILPFNDSYPIRNGLGVDNFRLDKIEKAVDTTVALFAETMEAAQKKYEELFEQNEKILVILKEIKRYKTKNDPYPLEKLKELGKNVGEWGLSHFLWDVLKHFSGMG